MDKGLIVAAVLIPSLIAPAVAQQPQPPASEQACNMKLGQEITGSLQCTAAVISLREENQRLQAHVKELESKLAPTPEPPKPAEPPKK